MGRSKLPRFWSRKRIYENFTLQPRQRCDSQFHFLLQALTPPGHEVVLIDGNAQPMDEEGIARYVREQNIGLVGIGAMTRMIAKAYRMADAVRAVGVKVVMQPREAIGFSSEWNPSIRPTLLT